MHILKKKEKKNENIEKRKEGVFLWPFFCGKAERQVKDDNKG